MSTEANKALVRRFFEEAVTEGKTELVDDLIAPDFVRHMHGHGAPVDRHGPEYIRSAIRSLHAAWGEFFELPIQMIAEGDLVACRVEMGGFHRGPYRGIPATGKRAKYEAYRFLRISDGRIAEMWSLGDSLGVLMQLGATVTLPGPPGEGVQPDRVS